MTQTIDPVFSSAVLSAPELALNDLDFDALSQAMGGLKGEVDKNPQTAAIILAGGTGERFGKEGGKQLVEIAGKPILTWSAEAFDAVGDIGLIVIVCPEDRCSEYLKRAIDPFPFVTPIVVAPSGPSRQESAFSGLEFVPDDYEYVILHDGARPLISPDLIAHTIATLKGNIDCDGAVVAHPAVDTLKVVENGVIVGTPDRRVFWNAQTPQVFRAGIYRRAHASALSNSPELARNARWAFRLVRNSLGGHRRQGRACRYRRNRMMQPVVFDPAGLRVGQGYDVHAFAEGRKLILGGVDVPHVRGLLGHSDADVLAHAISDALLGGIRGGDIGKLFPDTDPAFKDADSLKLLAAVADKVRAEGYVILDVDSVIAAQAPKLSPYREAMRENLAAAMGIAVENVGVKATTTEHLGFEGREEGISATAVCLLCRRPDEQRD